MQFTVLVFCAVSIKVHFSHHFSHRNLDELTLKIIFLQTSYFSQEYIKPQKEQTWVCIGRNRIGVCITMLYLSFTFKSYVVVAQQKTELLVCEIVKKTTGDLLSIFYIIWNILRYKTEFWAEKIYRNIQDCLFTLVFADNLLVSKSSNLTFLFAVAGFWHYEFDFIFQIIDQN